MSGALVQSTSYSHFQSQLGYGPFFQVSAKAVSCIDKVRVIQVIAEARFGLGRTQRVHDFPSVASTPRSLSLRLRFF